MLKMSTNFEDYQQRASSRSIATSPSSDGCSVDWAAHAKGERESIHSGQFMVSHFEAEEAPQDDLEDGEVKMLDPEDPSLSKPDEPAACTEVQLYVPRKVASHKQYMGDYATAGIVTSHLEIETSLTKLFKCMNLAYSQKLTSPKWNHFKGVRLRWKDKIRLNNVIWRCWHMQFIQKRRTPVCQFASPLDVDIHSNPQSVVLEGKYWKRQVVVIKAEYRKWRRNFKSNAVGCLTYDNKSELDFLEWSPINDRGLVLSSEDWTSDTLFSAINVPFPFPDPREIARGASIADFIQPSLGPLQPNLDEIDDITFAELLQHQRLPPVPEEGTDEMLKSIDYGLSAILGQEQIDTHNIMAGGSLQSTDGDANMMELNTPVCAVPYSEIEQQFVARGQPNIPPLISNSQAAEMLANAASMLVEEAALKQNQRNAATKQHSPVRDNLLRQSMDYSGKSVIKGRISKASQRPFRREPHNYDKAQPTLHQTSIYQQMLAEQQLHQTQLQPSMSNNLQMQNVAYPQQQQQQQPSQQQQQQQLQYANSQYVQSNASMLGAASSNNNNNNYATYSTQASSLPMVNVNGGMLSNTSAEMAVTAKSYGLSLAAVAAGKQAQQSSLMLNVKLEPNTVSANDVLSTMYGGGGMVQVNDAAYGNAAPSYKPYPNIANFKKSASTGNYINMRGPSPAINQQQQQQSFNSNEQPITNLHINTHQTLPLVVHCGAGHQTQLTQTLQQQQQQQQQQRLPYAPQAQLSPSNSQQQQQQQLAAASTAGTNSGLLPKEMFRSNSLPLNVSFQKLDTRQDNFAMPKQHISKGNKSRSRSNSIHHQHAVPVTSPNNGSSAGLQLTQQLQAATSDPMLNSTLAQLLTTNQRMSPLVKQQSSSTSAISTVNVVMSSSGGSASQRLQSAAVATTAASGGSGMYISPTQSNSASSTSSIVGVPTTANVTTTELLKRQQHLQHQHQHHHLQQKSPKKSTSLPAPVAPQILHNPLQPNKMLSFPLASSSAAVSVQLNLSPESFHDIDTSPLSPTHNNAKFPRDNQRRAGHIHAEQKRRYNIKNGFDMLHSLIPQLQQNPNAKLSKAAMLQKGAEYIKHLRSERNQLNDNMEQLRKERDALNNSLMHLHSKLPANGAPVTRQGTEHVRQLYEQYVQYRTMDNWKFWILGLILEPLLSSYTSSVSSASHEELRRTAYLWIDQHCSLIDLRPAVSNKLKYLSMKTDILSDPPSTLQEEVAKAVNNTAGQHPNLHGT